MRSSRGNGSKIEILSIAMILAFCSIIYELLLANTLAIVTGDYIWWQSLTIGIYIGGLGLGAYLSDQLKNTYESLVKVEIGLSFLGMVSVSYVYLLHAGYRYADNLFFYTGGFHPSLYLQNLFIAKVIFFILVQSMTLLIGFLSGFEIPLVLRMTNEDEDHQIFGINYIGTLIGTVCFAYWFLPKLDVVKTAIVVGMMNLGVCLYCIWRYLPGKKGVYGLSSAGVFLLGVFIFTNEGQITQRYLKLFYYMPRILSKQTLDIDEAARQIDSLPMVERFKSLYQYLDIYTYPTLGAEKGETSTILALDTNFQFNTSTEFYYHQAFAHAPILMNKSIPKKVLLLGGGDGLLLRELLKYPEIESIDFIELDEAMIKMAKTRFAELNHHSLDDPRVRVHINDAFYFLRNTTNKYDGIFIDFPYPNSYDLARLYSVEFYTYVRKALTPHGFVALDAPFFDKEAVGENRILGRVTLSPIFNETHLLSNSIIASTFYYAGFKTIFPYRVPEESFLFLKADPGAIDFDFMKGADLSKINPETALEMDKIKNQNFPFEISSKYVNSIFKPGLVKRNKF